MVRLKANKEHIQIKNNKKEWLHKCNDYMLFIKYNET